jgi:DNA repair exonuclease SbcCD ATPase subunit
MEQEKKENWSVRISSDTKNRLSALQQNFETGEAFILHALNAFDSFSAQGTTTVEAVSRGKAEVVTFARTAQAMIDQMQAIITLADSRQEQANSDIETIKTESDKKIAEFATEISENKKFLAEQKDIVAKLKIQNQELENSLKAASEHKESMEELKKAWSEKEIGLNARIAELDAEAKRTRFLEKEIVVLKEQVVQAQHKRELAEQKAELIERMSIERMTVKQNTENQNQGQSIDGEENDVKAVENDVEEPDSGENIDGETEDKAENSGQDLGEIVDPDGGDFNIEQKRGRGRLKKNGT